MTGQEGKDNCQKIVDILGLRTIFPLFMKPPKGNKKLGGTRAENEEHAISCVASLLKNCSGSNRQRVLAKFTENDHEKVDRLMELHFKYLESVNKADNEIEKERRSLDASDNDQDEEFYLKRLDAGLFTLQLVDYILIEISSATALPSIKQRVFQILNLRNGKIDDIKTIVREYANNLGNKNPTEGTNGTATDEPVAQDLTQKQHLLDLIEKF